MARNEYAWGSLGKPRARHAVSWTETPPVEGASWLRGVRQHTIPGFRVNAARSWTYNAITRYNDDGIDRVPNRSEPDRRTIEHHARFCPDVDQRRYTAIDHIGNHGRVLVHRQFGCDRQHLLDTATDEEHGIHVAPTPRLRWPAGNVLLPHPGSCLDCDSVMERRELRLQAHQISSEFLAQPFDLRTCRDRDWPLQGSATSDAKTFEDEYVFLGCHFRVDPRCVCV